MSKQLKQSTIEDLSQRVVTLAELPNGCTFRLFNKTRARYVRSDFSIKRKHIIPAHLKRPEDGDTLAYFLSEVNGLISTDLKARGLELRFYGPRGEYFAGNTHISTIRAVPGLPPEDDDDTVAQFGQIVQNAGLGDELSTEQVRKLYREMKETLSGFEGKLTKSADVIRQRAHVHAR